MIWQYYIKIGNVWHDVGLQRQLGKYFAKSEIKSISKEYNKPVKAVSSDCELRYPEIEINNNWTKEGF